MHEAQASDVGAAVPLCFSGSEMEMETSPTLMRHTFRKTTAGDGVCVCACSCMCVASLIQMIPHTFNLVVLSFALQFSEKYSRSLATK